MPKRDRTRQSPLDLPRFGRVIYQRRNDLGLTLNEVGTRAGFASGDYISLIERGKRAPDLDKVPFLADALQMDARTLCELWLRQYQPLAADALGIDADFHGSD